MPARAAKTDDLEGPTGRSWDEWLKFFARGKFETLAHGQIAQRLSDAGVSDWWSQMLTVAYEQHIGRRVPGQVAAGAFRTQANRTMVGDRSELLSRWSEYLGGRKHLGGLGIEGSATTSVTPKRSYWRANLANGVKLQVAFEPKPGGKTMLNVTIDKLESEGAVEAWRAVSKELLKNFS